MKESLLAYCKSIGIEYVGVAPKGPYFELKERLEGKVAEGHVTSFEEEDLEKRVDPSYLMEDIASIIVCLFPYFVKSKEVSNVSKYTHAIDYHILLKEKLDTIGEHLSQSMENFQYKSFVDTGPLPDRYLAYLAGLGFWGINSHIITEAYGSYFFIGYIVNNYPFEIDQPMEKTCIQCGSCVRNCPGQIILGDFSINPLGCKSYITQIKGELTSEEEAILKKTDLIYGCDVCQDVCPHNKNIQETPLEEFKEHLIRNIDYNEIKEISNKEFKKRYGNRAFSWRGKKILIRNYEIINNHKVGGRL